MKKNVSGLSRREVVSIAIRAYLVGCRKGHAVARSEYSWLASWLLRMSIHENCPDMELLTRTATRFKGSVTIIDINTMSYILATYADLVSKWTNVSVDELVANWRPASLLVKESPS